MTSKATVKDIESGNVPAFTGTESFRQIYPIGRNRLLNFCSMEGSPIIKNGRKIIIKTAEMIKFIENQAIGA